jgi:hypothetical protein
VKGILINMCKQESNANLVNMLAYEPQTVGGSTDHICSLQKTGKLSGS